MSHDLRLPLDGVIGVAELLIGEKAGPLSARQKEFLREIHRGGRQLLHLIDDLLHFARLGQLPLRRELVNVNNLVWEVLEELRSAEGHRSVDVRLGTLPDVLADSSLLKQVFANLLSNAFKFTRRVPHPLIEVEGRQQPGHCLYSIHDNGTGFDMTNAQRLFKIFH